MKNVSPGNNAERTVLAAINGGDAEYINKTRRRKIKVVRAAVEWQARQLRILMESDRRLIQGVKRRIGRTMQPASSSPVIVDLNGLNRIELAWVRSCSFIIPGVVSPTAFNTSPYTITFLIRQRNEKKIRGERRRDRLGYGAEAGVISLCG